MISSCQAENQLVGQSTTVARATVHSESGSAVCAHSCDPPSCLLGKRLPVLPCKL